MKFTFCIACIVALLLIGCSGTRQSTITEQAPAPVAAQPPPADEPDTTSVVQQPPTKKERDWNPKFIPTGFASGVMIEFTGMKKDATLHAKYASIELHPVSKTQTSDITHPAFDSPFTLTSTINDLRQAFFKVTPGKYQVRQIKEWAEQTVVDNVEVLEGSYSVIQFEVYNPRTMMKTTTELESGNVK